MYFDLEQLHKQVADVFDEVAAFRRDIHMHPELSEHEARTETKICDWLNALDIPYEKGIAGHGICATIYGQRTDKTAAIRADIDALPVTEQTGLPYASQNAGVMHACGHDMHTSILLGVAKILKANQASLPGTVRLLFQPSEETIGGARQMIEVGCLQDPDIKNIIALHVEPNVDCGKLEFIKGYMNAASCEFYLTVKGKSCHGAHPEGGIDVLPPACAIVSGLQTIVTRNLPATTPAIITVGRFHSGTANNIVSGEAKLGGILRTFDLSLRESIKQRILKIIYILQLMRRLHPFFQLRISFIAVIPYIPLIEGEVDLFLAVFFRFDCIADRNNTGDEIIHSLGACQEINGVICIISIVLMQ